MKIQKVVGIVFIEDSRFLIVQSHKSSKTDSWTLIGGGVEENESLEEAAIREVSEEIHNDFTINKNNLTKILNFCEHAASDPNKIIDMTIFLCNKKINVELTTNEEILHYHWYKVGENYNISLSIKDHFIPFAIKSKLIS